MPKHYHNLLKFTGKVFHFSQEKYRKEKNWNGKQRWKSSSAAILLELEEVERQWWQSPGRPAPAQLRQGLIHTADIFAISVGTFHISNVFGIRLLFAHSVCANFCLNAGYSITLLK